MGNRCAKADRALKDTLRLTEMNIESPEYSKTCRRNLRSFYNETMGIRRSWSKEPAGFDCEGRMFDVAISDAKLNRLLRQCERTRLPRGRRRAKRG